MAHIAIRIGEKATALGVLRLCRTPVEEIARTRYELLQQTKFDPVRRGCGDEILVR